MSSTVRIDAARYELSEWQPGSVRPWDEGVYERAAPAGPYACWTGKSWRRDAETPDGAARQNEPSMHSAASWRGLAESSGRPCMACRGHGIVDLGIDPDTGADLLNECADCG